MKIDDISKNISQINNLDTSTNKKIDEEKKPGAEHEKAIKSGTEVDLSDRSIESSRAAEMMHRIPEERAEKIEELKTKIRSGTYNVEATDIADKILDDALSNISEPE